MSSTSTRPDFAEKQPERYERMKKGEQPEDYSDGMIYEALDELVYLQNWYCPIAWTEDDMPEMGAENSFLQTISEIALTGYVGTEIGCQFPRDPAILNKEFGRRGISAITGWISTYLNELPMWQNERAFVDHMNFLKSIGATIINTSDQSFSIQHQWNTPLSNKKVLNDDE